MKRLHRRRICDLLIAVAACLGAAPAFGAITITGPADHLHQLVVAPDGDTVTLNPDPVTYLGAATANMQATLAGEWPDWSFDFSQFGILDGTLNIETYRAETNGPHTGGGKLEATYTRDANDPLIEHLYWIQMVDTNRPAGGSTSPYIDPRPNDDPPPFLPLPFYWTLVEDNDPAWGNKTDTTYHFSDFSYRPCATHPDSITWRGELMLAYWNPDNPAGTVFVLDGIRWGWDFQCVGGLPGDYNDDGKVDAADYVVWRKGLGTTYEQDDYDVWRARFGEPPGVGSGSSASANATVPEPATIMLFVGTLAMCFVVRAEVS